MDFMTWLNAYPSRRVVLEIVICVALYFILYAVKSATKNNKSKKRNAPHNKRFVYCSGTKRNIVYVDMVTQEEFDNAESLVGYGIIDRNNTSIYFDLNQS